MEGRNNIQGQETHSGSAWQEQMPLSNSGRSRLMMTTWSAAQPSQQIVKLGIQLHASTYSSFQHKSSTDYFPSFQRVPLKHFSVKTNNVRSNQTTLFLSECLLRLKCQARWVVYYMPVALPVTLYPCATLYVPTCSTTWADYLQTVLPLVGKRPAVFASAFSVLVSFTFLQDMKIVKYTHFLSFTETSRLLHLQILHENSIRWFGWTPSASQAAGAGVSEWALSLQSTMVPKICTEGCGGWCPCTKRAGVNPLDLEIWSECRHTEPHAAQALDVLTFPPHQPRLALCRLFALLQALLLSSSLPLTAFLVRQLPCSLWFPTRAGLVDSFSLCGVRFHVAVIQALE